MVNLIALFLIGRICRGHRDCPSGPVCFHLTYYPNKRYKRCPSIVFWWSTERWGGQSVKCIHGGAAFIFPVIQDYEFMDLTPISIEVNLINALSKQNIRVNVPSRFTIGVSTEPGIMQNAAERLLGLGLTEIQELAKEIIFGQLRLVVASMDGLRKSMPIAINFLPISPKVDRNLKSGIEVNQRQHYRHCGRVWVYWGPRKKACHKRCSKIGCRKKQDGSIGEANAVQDQRTRLRPPMLKPWMGENIAQIEIAKLQCRIADKKKQKRKGRPLLRKSSKLQRPWRKAYAAEQEAENGGQKRKGLHKWPILLFQLKLIKNKVEIDAEAKLKNQEESQRRGRCYFIQGASRSSRTVWSIDQTSSRFGPDCKAAGNDPQNAALLLIADKLPELVRLQSEAIKTSKSIRLRFGKVAIRRMEKPDLQFYFWDVQSGPSFTGNVQHGGNAITRLSERETTGGCQKWQGKNEDNSNASLKRKIENPPSGGFLWFYYHLWV